MSSLASSTIVISPQLSSSDISIDKYSHMRLVFEGSDEPVEIIIPLHCSKCHQTQQKNPKRSFTFASTPFPFGIPVTCPATQSEWTKLASDVYQWLKSPVINHSTDEWRWAVNYFWICYIASSPLFPVATNPSVDWDPEFVPLFGEFLHHRMQLMILGKYVSSNLNAEFIACLVEWSKLREAWILQGVDVKEFQRRIAANEM